MGSVPNVTQHSAFIVLKNQKINSDPMMTTV